MQRSSGCLRNRPSLDPRTTAAGRDLNSPLQAFTALKRWAKLERPSGLGFRLIQSTGLYENERTLKRTSTEDQNESEVFQQSTRAP